MTTASPKISSNSFLIHLPPHVSPQPIHLTITQLHPSTSVILHVTTNRNRPRLSDTLVVSMPLGNDVVSSRLEGLGGVDDDIDRVARLLAKKLERQFFVSGDLGGIMREVKGEAVSTLCRAVEQELKSKVSG